MKRMRAVIMIGLSIIYCLYNVSLARYELAYGRHYLVDHHAPSTPDYDREQLANTLDHLIRRYGMSAKMGVAVQSMRDGKVLYRYHDKQLLIPASTAKILIAQAALLYLGPRYRFTTKLLANARTIRKGTLLGDLYLVLSGDPVLDYDDLRTLFLQLKAKQIKRISGHVYIDNTAYDDHVYGPGWREEDKNYCYAAPIQAGIINRNCIIFKLAPAKHYAKIIHAANYFYPPIQNHVLTKRRQRTCLIHLTTSNQNTAQIHGCIPSGNYTAEVGYVVRNVSVYQSSMVRHLLRELAIQTQQGVTFRALPPSSHPWFNLGTHRSPPLQLLIHTMLKKSDNIIAAALFKKLGQLYIGYPGTWMKGQLAVGSILSSHVNLETSGMRLVDGSGLSTKNRLSALQMIQLLQFAYRHYPLNFAFISALPIAGVDGTLKHRLPSLSGQVRAKTGSLAHTGVISLAGYIVSHHKEPLAFMIMINGDERYSMRYKAIEDAMVNAIAHYRRF